MPRLDYAELVEPALLHPPTVRVLPDAMSHLQLRYRMLQGWRPLRLDLHLPAAGAGPWPVVVYVHGGSFVAGIPEMGPWCSLPRHGIAVASISYRLAGECSFPEPVEDVRAALAWTVAEALRFGLDPGRVALWGSSAGGYLAALAALTGQQSLGRAIDNPHQVPAVSAVALHYPVTDPARLRVDALPTAAAQAVALGPVVAAFFDPAPPSLARDLGAYVNPAVALPPFLLMHGDADQRVGPRQSERLRDALTTSGGNAQLHVVPGAGHGDPVFESNELVGEVIEFFQQNWARERSWSSR